MTIEEKECCESNILETQPLWAKGGCPDSVVSKLEPEGWIVIWSEEEGVGQEEGAACANPQSRKDLGEIQRTKCLEQDKCLYVMGGGEGKWGAL